MSRRLRPSPLAAAVLLLALPGSAQAQARASRAHACPGAYAVPSPVSMSGVRSATLCLVNYERAMNRLAPLRESRALVAAAASHSRDMARRNYFAHETLGGGSFSSRLLAARYMHPEGTWSVGENLAWGTGVLATPAATVERWMRSPGHKRVVLSWKFREIGVGVVLSGPRAIYTADFGRRGG